MVAFALNQVTVSAAPFDSFVEMAVDLGCVGIEARNDLGRPLFDGMDAAKAGAKIRECGLRLLGVSQIYPFNTWSSEIAEQTQQLIDQAVAAGAESISLIPRNDGVEVSPSAARVALKNILPMLEAAGMVALIEPLGFTRSSLRHKGEVADMIDAMGARDQLKLVHDTFHHTLAAETDFLPDMTGIVHISGVIDPKLSVDKMEDDDRVLVDEQDRLDNTGQIASLMRAGYSGAVSFECFSPKIHMLNDPKTKIRDSMNYISSQLRKMAA